MASDIFLYRKDRRWQKVSKVQEVFLTGGQTAYASVTGNATTNVVTITGATLADGMIVTFTSLTGGAGLSANVGYYAVNSSGATCQLALTQDGAAIDFTTTITAGAAIVAIDNMRVWSGEYRDIFSTAASADTETSGAFLAPRGSLSMPGIGDASFSWQNTGTYPNNITTSQASPTISIYSDEAAHAPLRQTLLNRTFWKFDRGASISPRYLYAEYMQGDQVLDNPPETE